MELEELIVEIVIGLFLLFYILSNRYKREYYFITWLSLYTT